MVINHSPEHIRRQQVRRKLNPLELQLHAPGDGVDRERFGQAGRPLQEDVASAEHGDQNPLDHLVLPNDDLVDLGGQIGNERALFFDELVDDSNVVATHWVSAFVTTVVWGWWEGCAPRLAHHPRTSRGREASSASRFGVGRSERFEPRRREYRLRDQREPTLSTRYSPAL